MPMSTRLSTRISSLFLICTLLSIQALAQSGPQLPNPGNAPMSRDQQIQLGFQAASEVYKQMPVLPDNSPETQYIRQIGQRLAATIPEEYSWPFEFHTIAQKEINAFALPGGPMFVNVGAINAAENEAQLAGVMAHEMAHVYMQHSAKQMQKNTVPSLISSLGQVLGSMIGGVGGAAASIGGQLTGGMLSMKYSRTDESQADAVGAVILYRAGYDPRALAQFFETLSAESGSNGGPQFLSDHPNPGNRQEAILREVQNWPPKQYRTSNAAFNQVRQHAKTLRLYTAQEIAEGAKSGHWAQVNKQNGAVFKAPPGVNIQPSATPASQTSESSGPISSRDVMPSSRMVSENLGPLTVSRPENWDVITPQQQGQSLTIAPRAGVTSNGSRIRSCHQWCQSAERQRQYRSAHLGHRAEHAGRRQRPTADRQRSANYRGRHSGSLRNDGVHFAIPESQRRTAEGTRLAGHRSAAGRFGNVLRLRFAGRRSSSD